MLFPDIPRTYERKVGKTVYVITSEPKSDDETRDNIYHAFFRLVKRDIESPELLDD